MLPSLYPRGLLKHVMCASQLSASIRVYRSFAWIFSASISLLSARHLLVEQNLHYPLQLYFNQLAVTAIISLLPCLEWQRILRLFREDSGFKHCTTKGTALLVASMCCTCLSTICFLQAALHFYNLPTLAMSTVRSIRGHCLSWYTC